MLFRKKEWSECQRCVCVYRYGARDEQNERIWYTIWNVYILTINWNLSCTVATYIGCDLSDTKYAAFVLRIKFMSISMWLSSSFLPLSLFLCVPRPPKVCALTFAVWINGMKFNTCQNSELQYSKYHDLNDPNISIHSKWIY